MRQAPAPCRPRAIRNPASPNPMKPIAGWVAIPCLISWPLLVYTAYGSMQVAATVANDHLPRNQFRIVAGQEGHQGGKMLGQHALLYSLVHHDALKGFLV